MLANGPLLILLSVHQAANHFCCFAHAWSKLECRHTREGSQQASRYRMATLCVLRPAAAGRKMTLSRCASAGASAMWRSPPGSSKASHAAMLTRTVAGSRPVLRRPHSRLAVVPC
jgi:hypothetical protein